MKIPAYLLAGLLLAGLATRQPERSSPNLKTGARLGISEPVARVDTQYNHFFTRYAGWNGGDGVYSTLLPDGRIFWTFGDTFLGLVKPDRTRPSDQNVMVRNSTMIQKGETFDGFTTLNQGATTTTAGQTYFIHAKQQGGKDWYWPLDATVYNQKLQVVLSHIQKTGSGSWDFKNASIDIAICSPKTGAIEKMIANKYQGKWGYGGALCEAADGYTYLYGVIHGNLTTDVVVARAPKGDLTATWQYWNGRQWGRQPDDYSIYKDASDQFSVFRYGAKYYLFTQEIVFGRRLFLSESNSPVGPWTAKRLLYTVPPEHGTGKVITYNALVHPELSKNGDLLISYCVNASDFADNFSVPGSADRYRPYFVRITNWP
ncbi:DUF5005 domain-containing protein [Larkinella terrae]|uniref:DUF5005 domain-containing protein n=1 Tax=Larkinella terrae TaxID=2025311 RepID=A0A7K0EEX8_9BACT|nr:DUF5005 domain-containing protein [Larkinella terrae]MRS60028.1 DUF5005 domain-containing protein [Larkinella terrae]